MQIHNLFLQKPARPSEIDGNLESRFFPEAFDDAFKTNRRDLFLRITKMCEQSDFCSRWYGLLKRHSGPVDTDVVKLPLHFHLVVMPIGNLNGHWTSNIKPLWIAHKVWPFAAGKAGVADDLRLMDLFNCLRRE